MTLVSGKGVHSGLSSSVRILKESGPVTFIRAGTRIPADHLSLASTNRATSLHRNGRQVSMVEHLLAALYIRGWWRNLSFEVSTDELPILDGSAAEWLSVLDSLGPPPSPPEPLRPTRTIMVSDGKSSASLEPGPTGLDVSISFSHPLIGRQQWQGGPEDYGQLGPARTFGFREDLDRLRQLGLGQGADLSNCLVFSGEGTMNEPRGADEPVRHKALDTLGDLYLLGQPVAGLVRTSCSSHALHARLVQEIRQHAGLETAS